MDHEFYATFGSTSRDENKIIYFSAKKERVLGAITKRGYFAIEKDLWAEAKSLPRVYRWVITVRATVGDTDGEAIIKDRYHNLINAIFDAFNLDDYPFDYWRNAKNKWSSLPKEVHEWHKQLHHDWLKRKYAKNHNINLLVIPYWDFDNIEKILEDYLSSLE